MNRPSFTIIRSNISYKLQLKSRHSNQHRSYSYDRSINPFLSEPRESDLFALRIRVNDVLLQEKAVPNQGSDNRCLPLTTSAN
jgi:hypothetical protein